MDSLAEKWDFPFDSMEIANTENLKNRGQQKLILAVLNIFNFGIILMDDEGKVIIYNSTARKLINDSGSLLISIKNNFRAVERRQDIQLQRLIRHSQLQMANQSVETGHLLIKSRNDGENLLLKVKPVIKAKAPEHLISSFTAIFIRETSRLYQLSTDGLGSIFKLTPSENRITRSLVNGLTIQDIASQRGTTAETVRGQLKAVFSKTGTCSQQELIRLSFHSELTLI